jgi:hypothetical protein
VANVATASMDVACQDMDGPGRRVQSIDGQREVVVSVADQVLARHLDRTDLLRKSTIAVDHGVINMIRR